MRETKLRFWFEDPCPYCGQKKMRSIVVEGDKEVDLEPEDYSSSSSSGEGKSGGAPVGSEKGSVEGE